MPKPDLFIIGAAKCGTTSMYEYLNGHPEIYMSPRKEPRYFSPDLISGLDGKNLRYGEHLDRYLALFDGAVAQKRLGEASVSYIYSREAPRLIREFQPRPYIVAMLRDPVEMMISLHSHHVSLYNEHIRDFEEALAAEPDRRAGRNLRPGRRGINLLYHDRARFGEQLQRWYDTVPRERIKVVILEDFVRSPASEFRSLLEFLEVDPSYQPPSFAAHNTRQEPRHYALRAVMRSRPAQWVKWKAVPAVFGDRRQIAWTARFGGVNRRAGKKNEISPELRRRLQADLADDVALTSRLVDRDLAALWWGADSPKASAAELAAVAD